MCSIISPTSCNILGESAPPERQVSPEKLYRAALLRSRFADIIIKARENTIEKVWNFHLEVKSHPASFHLHCTMQ